MITVTEGLLITICYCFYISLLIIYPYILYILWHWLSNMIYIHERSFIKFSLIINGIYTYFFQYIIYRLYPLGVNMLLKFNPYFETQITLKSYILTLLQAELYIYIIGIFFNIFIILLVINETKQVILRTRWPIYILLLLLISWVCPPDLFIQLNIWLVTCTICEIVFFFACLLKQYIN